MEVEQKCLKFADNRNKIDMDIALNQYTVDIPKADLNFFKKLVKKMGWTTHQTNNSVVNSKDRTVSSAAISPRLEWLRKHPVRLSEDELNDERTQYILNK